MSYRAPGSAPWKPVMICTRRMPSECTFSKMVTERVPTNNKTFFNAPYYLWIVSTGRRRICARPGVCVARKPAHASSDNVPKIDCSLFSLHGVFLVADICTIAHANTDTHTHRHTHTQIVSFLRTRAERVCQSNTHLQPPAASMRAQRGPKSEARCWPCPPHPVHHRAESCP